MSKKPKEIVEFKTIRFQKSTLHDKGSDFELPLITQAWKDKEVVIEAVEFLESRFGVYAVVKGYILENEKMKDVTVARTTSEVLLKQLEIIRDYLEENENALIKVKLEKKKSEEGRSYYTLV